MPEETVKPELPRAYSYPGKDIPKLRDQQDTNSCWAYASLSALEASKDEDASETYSVSHLLKNNPFGIEFEDGGSYVVTMAYLLSWMGPYAEDYMSDGENAGKPAAHVQEIRLSDGKDYEKMKEFLYCYGAVETAIYADAGGNIEESSYYNALTNSYSYSGEEQSNHDIIILGWDDDYPAENFNGAVTEDGAFLCRSSWGDRFGIDGSFYVSYEDANIGKTAVVYSRVDKTDNYDLIYQSDLCGFTAQVGYGGEESWFANVYRAEDNIFLRAAGFYATGKNTEYELYVVPDFRSEDSFRGRMLIGKGFLADAGYYTIDFPEAWEIDIGTDFALAVKIKTENAKYPVAIECQVDGLSENADLTDGRGYLSLGGQQWESVENTQNYNICLKAYADLR